MEKGDLALLKKIIASPPVAKFLFCRERVFAD